jgi:transcriptional regulator with XRE-family HTH domain
MSALRRIRKDVLSLSQAEIAALVGVSQGTVSKWENGELAPSLSEMSVIRAEALSRGIEWDDRWFFDPSPQTHEGEAA